MNEHTLCCGTVADKAKLCAEIAERDRVIAEQQRRIGELLRERDCTHKQMDHLSDIESALDNLVSLCNNSPYHSCTDEVIRAEAVLERLYKSRRRTQEPK